MTIPLGSKGQPDFDEPIALMMDCHRRIEHFLIVFQAVLDQYEGTGLDEEGARSLETALNYFRQAAPRHTADEEQSLFPRLRDCDDPEVRAAMAELDRLEADHRKAEAAHGRVDELGRAWLAAGRLDGGEAAELRSLLEELAAAYADHIALEDERVFALAGRSLDAAALREVGEEMRQRRTAAPGRAGSRCADRRRRQLNTSG